MKDLEGLFNPDAGPNEEADVNPNLTSARMSATSTQTELADEPDLLEVSQRQAAFIRSMHRVAASDDTNPTSVVIVERSVGEKQAEVPDLPDEHFTEHERRMFASFFPPHMRP